MVCTERTSKIAGGFVLVSVASLMACWRSCQSRPLGIGEFRAYLACHEMVARRCTLEDDRPASYSFAELAKLLGVTERRARESVGRLVGAGLLEWSSEGIGFPQPCLEDPDLADTIGRGRGSLAIPRRMLRYLVAGARPALIATVLGILLRCLSRRRGGFEGRGRVKASWIARVFGVDVRRVKAARKELVDLGWIEPESSDQRVENRYGRAFRIELGWSGGRTLPPLPPANRPAIATPSVDPEPLRERETPGTRPGATGVGLKGSGTAHTNSGPVGTKPVSGLPAPKLADVRVEDLRDTARTLKLFDLAVALGLVGSSEADRLQFVALAEHARAVGTANPPGLFMHLLRSRCWRYITGEDEDRARARLREHYHPSRPPERPAARVSTFIPDKVEAGPSGLGSVLAGLMGRFAQPPG